MRVVSYEVARADGERHETQLLGISGWHPVSWYGAAKLTQSEGRNVWELEGDRITQETVRAYHRDNRGKVTLTPGAQAGPDGTDIY